jgi:hypothetical protein
MAQGIVKLVVWMAGLAAALAIPASAWAGDQAYISWTLGDQSRRPMVTWEITGSSSWYVGVVQIATGREVDRKGDFLPENLVAYDVLDGRELTGSWVGPVALPPGEYFGRLKLRFDGPCQTNCESPTSVRSFRIDPPAIGSLSWQAKAGVGRLEVSWKQPKGGWYVSLIVVDDNRSFASPEDAIAWPSRSKRTRWTSGTLPRGTYFVRVRVRHATCDTCIWTSDPRKVVIKRSNPSPELRPVRFEITRRAESGNRHWWTATFTVCDRTPGELTVEILEETGPAGGAVSESRRATRELPAPGGCREYAVVRRSSFPFADGSFVRVAIRVHDALGAWSVMTRKVTWEGAVPE